jgi:hypothetical protein
MTRLFNIRNPFLVRNVECSIRNYLSAFLICTLLFADTGNLSAQSQAAVIATLSVDSTHIMIGDQLKLRLAVKHPKNVKIYMPTPKDSIGRMDFVRASKIDTIKQADDEVIAQSYLVSAYDSGNYVAGPVMVFFKNAGGNIDSVLSNSINISVSTIPVDTVKPYKPIKGPLEVPFTWREFLPYILGGLLLIILIVAGVWFWRKYRKAKPVVQGRPVPKDPPHIWVRKELKKLEEEKLWQKDQVKLYYSRLTDILRLYLEFRFNWLALESTTEEIESQIDSYNMKDKAKDSLLQILRTADLVKFAKMLPGPDANIKAMESANKFVDFTEPKEEKEN